MSDMRKKWTGLDQFHIFSYFLSYSCHSYIQIVCNVNYPRLQPILVGRGGRAFGDSIVCRTRRGKDDPRTPDIHRKCSKRAFDGLVRSWRRALHKYDPEGAQDDDLDADLRDEADQLAEDSNEINVTTTTSVEQSK
jgi:hypothetical protein